MLAHENAGAAPADGIMEVARRVSVLRKHQEAGGRAGQGGVLRWPCGSGCPGGAVCGGGGESTPI